MIDYKIEKTIATISSTESGYTLELNLISFNGKPAKYDLRRWLRIAGQGKMLKGISLSKDEMSKLLEVLEETELGL